MNTFVKLWLNQSAAFMVISIFLCVTRSNVSEFLHTKLYFRHICCLSHRNVSEGLHTTFQVLYPPAITAGLMCQINWCLSSVSIIKCTEANKLR